MKISNASASILFCAGLVLAAACASSDAIDVPTGIVDAGTNDASDARARDAGDAGDAGDASANDAQSPPPPLLPLDRVPLPTPTGGDIIDIAAAVRLGKALFWDQQAGGDGVTACASCHFSAGTDNRVVNTVNPGADSVFDSFGVKGSGQIANRQSTKSNDVWGSQGVVATTFDGLDPDSATGADRCTPTGNANRQVTGRNAPSVIGAVFNRENFWDGRANAVFNGKNPFGRTANNSEGSPMAATPASLASQAVGPATNAVEMSCAGRTFADLGKKMLARIPLANQEVSKEDSVLGALSKESGGLSASYMELVTAAFGATFATPDNFSRVWGQALQAYEATLIPSQTPFDRYLGGDAAALSDTQRAGLDVFNSKGRCSTCHAGSELSDATVGFASKHGLVNKDGGDQGFHNIGVRPTSEDLGRAAKGPGGASWSVSGSDKDRGAFKTPGLRNVKLTAPYFHNGGTATLQDVVFFYIIGGEFGNAEKSSQMQNMLLSAPDVDNLLDFLTNALTDCRTEKQRAPFDHPSLTVPNGANLAAVGKEGIGACPAPAAFNVK